MFGQCVTKHACDLDIQEAEVKATLLNSTK